jgi:hypothetical protein
MAAATSCTIRRAPGPIAAALCWAHGRRRFFELADIAANARRSRNAAAISPVALEAVRRIDLLFDIERSINGQSAEERLQVRREQSAPLLAALEAWLRQQRARLSNSSAVAGPIDYLLKRWNRYAGFVEDGRICLTNNAAERALRGFALGASHGCSPAPNAAPTARRDGDADHDGEAQRRRSASLARRRARPHRRPPG